MHIHENNVYLLGGMDQDAESVWVKTLNCLGCILNNALKHILTVYSRIRIITLFLISKTGIIMCTLNNNAYW